jgi:RNA polymerase sigma factor (sigma-70 family)
MDKGYIRRLETADSVASIDEKPEGGDPYLELFGDDGVEGRVIASTVADELRNLDERTEDIIRRRWLLGQSYREIAEGYDVTRERVRQIAVEGLAELRGLLGVEA